MATTDLISREAAVREALRCYRGAQEAVRQCREAEDDFGTLAFEGQKEAYPLDDDGADDAAGV